MLTTNTFIGIAGAVIFNIILGTIWYSPKLLGSLWLKAYRFKSTTLMKPTALQYAGTLLISFIIAIVISTLVSIFDLTDPLFGLYLGFLFWLGFIATTEFSSVIWEKKPLKGYFIDVGYWLISLLCITPFIVKWH